MSQGVSPVNIIVLASGYGSNLQAIIDAINSDRLSARLTAVISDQKNAFALERAQRENVPAIYVNAGKKPDRKEFDRILQEALYGLQFELIILAGFMRILSTEFVERYHGCIMNIHPSLLPRHKGTNTHERVLRDGDEFHGATVHFVTPELDAGPIILQKKFKVAVDDTAKRLKERVHECEHRIYPKAIQLFAESLISI